MKTIKEKVEDLQITFKDKILKGEFNVESMSESEIAISVDDFIFKFLYSAGRIFESEYSNSIMKLGFGIDNGLYSVFEPKILEYRESTQRKKDLETYYNIKDRYNL